MLNISQSRLYIKHQDNTQGNTNSISPEHRESDPGRLHESDLEKLFAMSLDGS